MKKNRPLEDGRKSWLAADRGIGFERPRKSALSPEKGTIGTCHPAGRRQTIASVGLCSSWDLGWETMALEQQVQQLPDLVQQLQQNQLRLEQENQSLRERQGGVAMLAGAVGELAKSLEK